MHLSQLHTLVKLTSDNKLRPLTDFQYESMLREAGLHVFFYFFYIALLLTFHLFFVTDNVQKGQR